MLSTLAQSVGELLQKKQLSLAAAESCTGGEVAQIITSIEKSSSWFERGFVTYSNSAKQELLGVPLPILEQYGAVSAETARAMAEGALRYSRAQVSLSITGIAGPDGGTAEKPVGTVWFAWAGIGSVTQVQHKLFSGDRLAIRDQAAKFALQGLINFIKIT